MEQERLRAARQLENKRAAKRDSYHRLSATYLEGEDELEEGNIAKIKQSILYGATPTKRKEEEPDEVTDFHSA